MHHAPPTVIVVRARVHPVALRVTTAEEGVFATYLLHQIIPFRVGHRRPLEHNLEGSVRCHQATGTSQKVLVHTRRLHEGHQTTINDIDGSKHIPKKNIDIHNMMIFHFILFLISSRRQLIKIVLYFCVSIVLVYLQRGLYYQ